ncbi:helix-turn-helix domain-containing protein [Aromatoleum evansii]|nr:helix-turn-helix domain-containing protein [Aromatoleum evansii]
MYPKAAPRGSNVSAPPRTRRLSVAFLLAPRFTLVAFSAFVDALRLAADEGDSSRPIDCDWQVLSQDMQPITASCGLKVSPTSPLVDPTQFDYIVVVGGLLPHLKLDPELSNFIQHAAARRVPLIGICTAPFILARLGLMENRRSCVSWYVASDFAEEFPGLPFSSEELFIDEGDRLSCAGGTSVVHLAAHLIERHCDKARAAKALRIMIEHTQLPAQTPQPLPPLMQQTSDTRVRKAILLIERHISTPVSAEFIAQHVNISVRHLERLFLAEVGMTPVAFAVKLRMATAYNLLVTTQAPILDIALECGFLSNSHFSRSFKQTFGKKPSQVREEECAHQHS